MYFKDFSYMSEWNGSLWFHQHQQGQTVAGDGATHGPSVSIFASLLSETVIFLF